MNQIKINQNHLSDLLSDETQWESRGLDPAKGIILIGNPGVGKTYGMKEWARTKKIGWGHPNLPSEYKDLRDLSTKLVFAKCEQHGPSYLIQFAEDHEMWLDDIGFEPTECNSFGTKFIPIQDLLFYRHQLFPRRKTHLTSNYTLDQLGEKYGPAIVSRIKEMCNVVYVEGIDRR